VALLTGIKRLLHEEGLTIRGVQKILRDHGVRHVAGLSEDAVPVAALDLAETVPDHAAAQPAGLPSDMSADSDPGDEDLQAGEAVASPLPAAPGTSGLPLFDTPPTPAPPEAPAAPRKRPVLRDDATFSSLIRALPPEGLRGQVSDVADLARRLSALRARVAARADGGNG
jgi:hypothetical protein